MTAPAAGVAGPRALLKRLRAVMAGPGSAQERLDAVVTLVAGGLVAEVCSLYVMRAGQVLELFATEGLKADAVHHTRLRVGEGLVGRIAASAAPLNLSDARAHPDFAYRPETGEEIYRSLMGVPLLRDGRVIGVLVVQNRAHRHYDDEEIEALETIAMVLAELVASSGLITAGELFQPGGNATIGRRIDGVKLAHGLAIGSAVVHQPEIIVSQFVAERPDLERERLREAITAVRRSVDEMIADHGHEGASGVHLDILETYRMFAEDRGWLARIGEAIDSGLTAEAAVLQVRESTRARMSHVSDPYLRERLLDLEDLENRLLFQLAGRAARPPDEALPDDVVVVARNFGAAELLDYARGRLRAAVLEEGSPTAHVAIVARALDIPVVGQARGALSEIAGGDRVIVDGDRGHIFVNPADDIVAAYEETLRGRHRRRLFYAGLRDLPSLSRDEVRVALDINAGLPIETIDLEALGADGVGLYRSEMPFMIAGGVPDIEAQTAIYRRVLEQVGDRRLVVRTLDIGGDKIVPGFHTGGQVNPALGWRALRIALDRPAVLRCQVRALFRAAAGRTLDLMFPMVTEVAEFEAARAIVALECRRAEARGEPLPTPLRLGAMFEVPALAWQLEALLARVDFLSVGSNDLMQFLFASDRNDARLINRYDTLAPALLTLLRTLVARADAAGVEISLCGEMAGRPLEAMALVGLGFRRLSMMPSAVGPVKAMVRSLDVGGLTAYLESLHALPDHSLRGRLLSYAKDHGVFV